MPFNRVSGRLSRIGSGAKTVAKTGIHAISNWSKNTVKSIGRFMSKRPLSSAAIGVSAGVGVGGSLAYRDLRSPFSSSPIPGSATPSRGSTFKSISEDEHKTPLQVTQDLPTFNVDTLFKTHKNHLENAQSEDESKVRQALLAASRLPTRDQQAHYLQDFLDTHPNLSTQNLRVLTFVVATLDKIGVDKSGHSSTAILEAAAKYMSNSALTTNVQEFQEYDTKIANATIGQLLNSQSATIQDAVALSLIHFSTGMGNRQVRQVAMKLLGTVLNATSTEGEAS